MPSQAQIQLEHTLQVDIMSVYISGTIHLCRRTGNFIVLSYRDVNRIISSFYFNLQQLLFEFLDVIDGIRAGTAISTDYFC